MATAPAAVERLRKLLKTGMPGPHAYVILLGLNRFDYPGIIEEVEKGLPYAAFERLQKNTGFTNEQLADVLQIPRRTMARRKTSGRFAFDESDRLVRLARVYAKALYLFDGDASETTRWFLTIRRALRGVTPLEMTRTSVGALEVENLIGRIEHGVFS
jgi:putative toxin-antitoxin system antitoxin component (TIGR02293 family)